jgi:hypothetical protein
MIIMYHNQRGLFDKLLMDSGATFDVVNTSQVPILALKQKTSNMLK